jgi:hypothetical protein
MRAEPVVPYHSPTLLPPVNGAGAVWTNVS